MTKWRGAALPRSFIALMFAFFASFGWAGTPPPHSFTAYLIEGYGEVVDNAGNQDRTSSFGSAGRSPNAANRCARGRGGTPALRDSACNVLPS
jgi:hypothetical protein